MKIVLFMLAQATHPTSAPVDQPPSWFGYISNPLLMFGVLIVLMMLVTGNKGKKNEQKQRDEMLKQLKRGERIQTIGGVLGSVTRVEENRVEVKVDESNNTKMWFARTAILKVVDADKAEKTESK